MKREKKEPIISKILGYINDYMGIYSKSPSVREIEAGTGVPRATVQRYLIMMKEEGMIEYNGKCTSTEAAKIMNPINFIKVLGRVACGPGEDEQEEILEYIRMPECLVGKGEVFALIAKGDSMIDAGIHDGDYVFVRKTSSAEPGDIVVALYEGLSNLKVLEYDETKREYYLASRNPDREKYADIRVTDLQVQGIAVGVYRKLRSGIKHGR